MTTDARDWFKSVTGRKVTTVEISGYLGVSRNTTTERYAHLAADAHEQVRRAFVTRLSHDDAGPDGVGDRSGW